jgi:hypothetical protein
VVNGLATENVQDVIAEGRQAILEFDDRGAARILGRAAHMTSDGELLEEIYELALLGSRSSKAGRPTRAMRWHGVIEAAQQRLEAAREREDLRRRFTSGRTRRTS